MTIWIAIQLRSNISQQLEGSTRQSGYNFGPSQCWLAHLFIHSLPLCEFGTSEKQMPRWDATCKNFITKNALLEKMESGHMTMQVWLEWKGERRKIRCKHSRLLCSVKKVGLVLLESPWAKVSHPKGPMSPRNRISLVSCCAQSLVRSSPPLVWSLCQHGA